MFIVIIATLLLVFGTTVIHYEVLRLLNTHLPAMRIHNRLKLPVVIFSAFTAHAIEIGLYGIALFILIDQFAVGSVAGSAMFSLETCVYFSAENYTSLGFGDLVPIGPVRLLAGVEALNGLLLIAWTASFTFLAMQKFWSPEAELDRH